MYSACSNSLEWFPRLDRRGSYLEEMTIEGGAIMQINRSQVLHWAGLAFILAGVLWVVFALVLFSQPQGCVGSACDLPGRSYRPWGLFAPALFVVTFVLLIAGMAAVAWVVWNRANFGKGGRMGLLLSAVGGILIVVLLVIQMLFFNGDFPLMPFFLIPAGLALILGFLLLGVALMHARIVPLPVGVLWLLSALVLIAFNTEDIRVLLAVPLGLSWVIVGACLWMSQDKPVSTHVAEQKPGS